MKASTDKMIVLGVDGFDPSLAKKFMNQGKMPNLKKFVEKGSAREDLVLLGALPTVTPPMWTTLATGAYPMTHGITGFFNQHPEKLDSCIYALDSRMCKAEQLWNVFAESGKQTLVWHWPGSSWPPSSDSPNLAVVDGTQPPAINMGVGVIDWEKLGVASTGFETVKFAGHDSDQHAGAGCVITDLEDTIAKADGDLSGADALKTALGGALEYTFITVNDSQTEINLLGNINTDIINSPIKPAEGWADAPADAKEFTMITSAGFVRRPCLILINPEGIYDRVAVYRSKKETTPIVILENDVYTPNIIDEIIVGDETKIGNRCMRILELAPDGSYVRYWLSLAIDVNQDAVFHPKELLQEVSSKVGPVLPIGQLSGKNAEHAEKLLLPAWDYYSQWQASCLTYFMENNKYEVIFSHLHNVDLLGHQFWHFAKHRDEWGNDENAYQGFIQYVYEQTDRYLGRFLPFLDQDWTIIITSDHGLITEENHPPMLGEVGVNVPVMKELGYTALQKDANGNEMPVIDWSRTKAVARDGNIYLNLIGRTPYGIVDPKDQYALEEEIISALYNYRDPRTGRRSVAIALRNKDGIILGVSGPLYGDILYFVDEGFNIIHNDSLSTQVGYFDTSVSPIFVAAGKGIKAGFTTDRVIREVDVAPTMAALGGVRMPAQCEGAPVYQILTEEY